MGPGNLIFFSVSQVILAGSHVYKPLTLNRIRITHVTVSRAQFAAAHARPYLPVALTTLVHAGGALRLASGTLPESVR